MKKSILILSSLFLTVLMQGQIIPQPKPGVAPTIKIGKPVTFELKNGLKVMVVENHKLPRVSFNLTLDNDPYTEGDKKGVADMTSTLIGSGTTKISKTAFNEEVDFLGANINFSSNGASASALSKYSGRVLELMADGALNPNFTQEEFDKEKTKLIEGLKANEKSVSAVAARVVDVLTYGKNHPAGEYVSEATLKNVTLADVKANYSTYFVPSNAYLIIVGDVKFKETKKMVEKFFGSWKKASAPSITFSDPKDVAVSQINFIDMPNAVQSEVAVVNMSNLKMTDPDYFAVLVANQILGGDFNSYINMNLREAHGWTYGARTSIYGDKRVSTFNASTQVRNAVTDSTVVEIFKEFKKIRTEKVTDEMLASVKAGYIGRFVMQIEKPQTVAGYALRIQTQSLPADFYENYIKNISAVTADDILRVANKYFLADNSRIVIVGKAADVAPSLEKLKFPVSYSDKYGNPTAKPEFKKPVPAGVTAKIVIDNYIKAIGGEKAALAVKTVVMNGTTTIPQAPSPLNYTSKIDAKGKLMVELAMGTMSIMKQVVNEKGAYVMQQGQRQNIEGTMLADLKADATPFVELALSKKQGLTLETIESVNGKDAYAVKNGKTTLFYDVTSGLKLAESKVIEQGGQSITQTTNYGDYKEVKGVKVPFNIIQNVGFELDIKMSDVKINEGVTDADFQ
ncbi:Predicted Zn-dependent peptidase [Flavobacterium fryxellicola]|uniref:Peptidase M16 n=1 Tax=Flavobacterium fryxellicola TaxID=249352 RepID=A0A167X278_9FLAO|nr:pitrilysin family protein [Flavobacterium fryxellicola]OAB27960.1 peptidase M16 [Flavobacterium fryxellicola]SHN65405.1 Predicted Zn-dependent peptidase [Flavobacterium fryxellicola]